jgi:hypothetical protein
MRMERTNFWNPLSTGGHCVVGWMSVAMGTVRSLVRNLWSMLLDVVHADVLLSIGYWSRVIGRK